MSRVFGRRLHKAARCRLRHAKPFNDPRPSWLSYATASPGTLGKQGRDRRDGRASRVDDPAIIAFKHKAAEHASGVGAGVDTDPVILELGLKGDTVAVDHDLPMVLG